MTKQQAPHSPERCAGVPGHKKDAAAREGTHYPAARHPRLKAVVSYCKEITAGDWLYCATQGKNCTHRTAPMQSNYKKQQK